MLKMNGPGCGCSLKAKYDLYDACLTNLEWCIAGTNAELDVGDGEGPQPVDNKGTLATYGPGPYTLTSDGCSRVITCTAGSLGKCLCGAAPYATTPIGGRRLIFSAIPWDFDLTPCSVQCSKVLAVGSPATTIRVIKFDNKHTTLSGPAVTLNWDFPVAPYDAGCGTRSTAFHQFIGTYTYTGTQTAVDEVRDYIGTSYTVVSSTTSTQTWTNSFDLYFNLDFTTDTTFLCLNSPSLYRIYYSLKNRSSSYSGPALPYPDAGFSCIESCDPVNRLMTGFWLTTDYGDGDIDQFCISGVYRTFGFDYRWECIPC